MAAAGHLAVRFEPLYYPERLHRVNPLGDVGIVTLWSPMRAAARRLDQLSPGILAPATSRVAVASNLYGDGLHAMLCNLLFNPQVRHLVAVGEDLGLPTCAEIEAFLEHGVERTVLLGRTVCRVVGTDRIFPDLPGFDVDRLRSTLSFRHLGRLSDPAVGEGLTTYLDGLPRRPDGWAGERVRVDIPRAMPDDYSHLPSDLAAHQVVRRGPLDCWEELVTRCVRFGRPVTLRDGPRLELLNARAVVTAPVDEPAEVLARHGFSLERFHAYQQRMLDAALPPGISYTYGNRLRAHFGADTLATVVELLRDDPQTRRGYVSLWDTATDLPHDRRRLDPATPCLATLFFRVSQERLTLTATYRSHNLLTAWLENVYGLMAVQRHVAERVGLTPGPLTVISHSLGIDPRNPRYELAQGLADAWTRDEDVDRATGRHTLREDPNGYFVVTTDDERGEIVAEHRYGGLLVKRYHADRAVKIEREIIGDLAVSLVSHALWLGRELMTREQQLRRRRGGTSGADTETGTDVAIDG